MPRTNVVGTTAPSGSGRPANDFARSKTRATTLAEQLLRDRAERTARPRAASRPKVEGSDFDPFAVARWRVIAGGNPGYLVKTPMRRGPVGWFIACRGCALEFERHQGNDPMLRRTTGVAHPAPRRHGNGLRQS